MKTLKEGAVGEIVEKKSRFIGTCLPVSSEEEAREFVARMKKQYYDARHNCYAWTIGPEHENTKSSDDGEPSGTAGKPILEVLLREDIHNICMVVTRYFGGTLLGTGGLVRAYTDATKESLANSLIQEEIFGSLLKIECTYNDYGALSYYIESEKIPVVASEFTDRVSLTVFVTGENKDSLIKTVSEKTNGSAAVEEGEEYLYTVGGN